MYKIATFFVFLLFLSPLAHAQYQRQNWWALGYDFTQIKINELKSTEIGHIPTLDLELGVSFSPTTAFAIRGVYGENSLTFQGTTLNGIQVDQLATVRKFDLRGDVIYMFTEYFFNIGYATRNLYDSVPQQPSRDSQIHFLPIGVTYWAYPYYLKAEYRRWLSAEENVKASELGGGRQDVSLKQNDGNGYSFEVGYLIQRPLGVKLSLQWEHWHVDGSNSQNDFVENLSEPDQTITETTLGLGLIF